MKLQSLHAEKEGQVWTLAAYYEGKDGSVDATRTYTWQFLNTTELLAKADELLKGEQN